jgi:hypothetical protein
MTPEAGNAQALTAEARTCREFEARKQQALSSLICDGGLDALCADVLAGYSDDLASRVHVQTRPQRSQ